MNVYTVVEGTKNEGNSVVAVMSTLKKADKLAKRLNAIRKNPKDLCYGVDVYVVDNTAGIRQW